MGNTEHAELGEDNGIGIKTVKFRGNSPPVILERGKPSAAEWGIQYLPRCTWQGASVLNAAFPVDEMAYVKRLRGLKSLSVGGTSVTDKFNADLSIPSVNALMLQDCPVTDTAVRSISSQSNLYILSLAQTKVCGETLGDLEDLNLFHIDLTGCPVTVNGLQALATLPNLEWLTLDRTPLDDSCIPALCQLKTRFIGLRGTKMTPIGLRKYFAEKPAFSRVVAGTDHDDDVGHEPPSEMELDDNWRQSHWMKLLASGGKVDYYESRESQPFTDLKLLHAEDRMPKMPIINLVDLQHAVENDDDLAMRGRVICGERLPVKLVDLTGTSIDGTGFRNWKRGVREIRLANTRLHDEGLQWLSRIRIPALNLDGTRITDAGTKWLRTYVEQLSLNDTATGDLTLANLARHGGAANLRELSMDGTKVTNQGLEQLKNFPRLERLSVNRTGVTEAGVQSVKTIRPTCTVIVDNK